MFSPATRSRFFLLLAALLLGSGITAQKLRKPDRLTFSQLQLHTGYLADDRLEGRRTGTPGEALAYNYIR
ncbi:MAG TPA: hypothetical protein PKE63_13980, partial [Lacibacter sp.]|nr:hypothetical protein [Lacibacter sp.]